MRSCHNIKKRKCDRECGRSVERFPPLHEAPASATAVQPVLQGLGSGSRRVGGSEVQGHLQLCVNFVLRLCCMTV